MVWGMALPKNFGKFWPDGDFGSWSGDLVRYYMAQPPEMQLALYDGNPDPVERAVSYPHYVNGKFTNETGSRMSPRPEDPPFSPIKEHEAPQVFITGKTYDELGSLVMFNDGIVAVDDRLRKIIENFEPGSHQFFRSKSRHQKGRFFKNCIPLWLASISTALFLKKAILMLLENFPIPMESYQFLVSRCLMRDQKKSYLPLLCLRMYSGVLISGGSEGSENL